MTSELIVSIPNVMAITLLDPSQIVLPLPHRQQNKKLVVLTFGVSMLSPYTKLLESLARSNWLPVLLWADAY